MRYDIYNIESKIITILSNKKHQFGLDDYVFAALTLYRNAPDPIQGVMIRGKGRGTDHYTLDGVGGIPNAVFGY